MLVALLAVVYFVGVHSHGMMMDPVSRGSRWRVDGTALKNYDDNALFCGGFYVHYSVYAGRCGVCGDSYGDATPRPHENGGIYGMGDVIVKSYVAGESATISVRITQNHLGYFTFHLCNLDNSLETEDCFAKEPLELTTGGYKFFLNSDKSRMYETSVIIPSDITCDHCVIRWTYTAGNSWGICENGTGAIGCGPQETYKNCADVAIKPPSESFFNEIPQ